MCDYQKNVYAANVIRELASAECDYLALFGFQDLMQIENGKKPVLQIIKAYIDKKELPTFEKVVDIVESIIIKSELRKEVLDFIVF
jgi:hypothetical protein